jgi:4-diphosphocytidyl-2-C-methyl-D-erythritol kinase
VHLKVRDDGLVTRAKPIANVSEEQDLCIRAARLLQQHTGCKLGVEMAVDKRIPMGGGLGGGSSDAATVLVALNHLWKLQLSRRELMDLGLKLGADVPFFIFGQNAWVEGVGEKIQPIPLNLGHFVILTPQTHVSTAEVFSSKELTRNTFPTTIAAFHEDRINKMSASSESRVGKVVAEMFKNDLAAVVYQKYPEVASCADCLDQFERSKSQEDVKTTKLSYSKMSGSGASVFAEFENATQAQQALLAMPEKLSELPVFKCVVRGLSQHPLYNLV